MPARAPQADHLTLDAVVLLTNDTWFRVAQYSKSHRLSPSSPTDSRCGLTMIVDVEWWNRAFPKAPWYIAVEGRKSGTCTQCKGNDLFEHPEYTIKRKPDWAPAPSVVAESTPAQRLEDMRFDTVVSRVLRELGGTIVEG